MQTVLITGGTGLVGTALTKHLVDKGYHIIILSRSGNKKSENPSVSYAQWNVEKQTIDEDAVRKADYIIHLAGAAVADKRWSEKRKKEIVQSRTLSGALLVKGLAEIPNNVKAVISASATGWYGADEKKFRGKKGFTEDAAADTEFLGETCRQWEESISPVERLGKRLVKLRTGIVLSNDGGALKEFKKPVKAGVAAVLGNGKQVVSWIHIDDLCRLFLYVIEKDVRGVYNAVAPNPVTNKELMLKLATKMRGNFFIPLHVPAFIIKLLFGGMSIEVLKSVTVSSEKVREAGFTFLYPSLDVALNQLTTR
jgi:uncharacterized protein (TIGR01777 family)